MTPQLQTGVQQHASPAAPTFPSPCLPPNIPARVQVERLKRISPLLMQDPRQVIDILTAPVGVARHTIGNA
jgi:hypothetical protein